MKYAPGSFSKNFAWHGTGLRKLHTSIKSGFQGKLVPVSRADWRAASGINDSSLELVPINFFLHNRAGLISVDELVFQAITKRHSIEFDRLALFALHLNRAGSGTGVVGRPAMWANEFVRELLWEGDTWKAAQLSESMMDAFITNRLNANQVVRVKCRSNYRHLFELCGYLSTKLPIINSGADQWLPGALFLTWDRHIHEGGRALKSELIAVVRDEELHKLFGTSEQHTIRQANALVDVYLRAGNVGRFALPSNATISQPSVSTPSPTPSPQTEIPEETTSVWIDQDESDTVVERRNVELQAQVRDRKKAAALKRHYQNTCVFCEAKLQISSTKFYSEAAHVRALGKPHNGPDRVSNMLVLCPNHHLQFDRGILRLKKTVTGFIIQSEVIGDSLHGKQISLKHNLDEDVVKYHADWHSQNWR